MKQQTQTFLEELKGAIGTFRSQNHWTEVQHIADRYLFLTLVIIVLGALGVIILICVDEVLLGLGTLSVGLALLSLVHQRLWNAYRRFPSFIRTLPQEGADENRCIYVSTSEQVMKPLRSIQCLAVPYGKQRVSFQATLNTQGAMHNTPMKIWEITGVYHRTMLNGQEQPHTEVCVRTSNKEALKFALVGETEESELVKAFKALLRACM